VEISRRPDFSLLLRTENRRDPATRHVMLITGLPNHTPLWLRMTGASGSRAGTPQVVGPLTLTP
jgi:hypothetical protein